VDLPARSFDVARPGVAPPLRLAASVIRSGAGQTQNNCGQNDTKPAVKGESQRRRLQRW